MRALDLGREHRLFSHIRVNEELQVGKNRGQTVKPPQRLVRLFQHVLQRPEAQRGIGWKRRRQRRADRFAPVRFRNVTAEPRVPASCCHSASFR